MPPTFLVVFATSGGMMPPLQQLRRLWRIDLVNAVPARFRVAAHWMKKSIRGLALTFPQNGRTRMARKKAKATSEASTEETSIEQAMDELNGVVAALETGQESLDDSLKLFERGMSLLRVCHRQLDAAAQRIEVITALDADGTVETAAFDGTATAGKTKAKKAARDAGGELF